MKRHLVTVVATLLIFTLTGAAEIQQCPLNEEYTTCGSACPPTCQDDGVEACTDNCIPGCVCAKDFIREAPAGRCVPKGCQNTPKCGLNEKFTNCATLCPRVCNETQPKLCPLVCVTGCVCEENYVREKADGKCIPQVGCNEICRENEVYTECGSPCPSTCSQPIKVCERKCVRGCSCRDGFVIDDKTNKCVREEECPNP